MPVDDVDFRLALRPRFPTMAVRPAVLLAAGVLLLFLLGILDTLLTTTADGYSRNSTVYWFLLLVLFAATSTVSFLCVRTSGGGDDVEAPGAFGSIAIALVCSVALITSHVAGIWAPFLAGWGGRTVREFERAAEFDWPELILLYAFLGGVVAFLTGMFAGLLAWLSRYTPRIADIAQRAPWPWRLGLGIPLLLGIVLAVSAAVSWVSGGYERPDTLEAGRAEEFANETPVLFEEDDVWLVRLNARDFLALYDRGRESGCPLQWRREFEFMDRTGWFVDACTGSAYDINGRCFSPPCRGASLDSFPVAIINANVVVDLRILIPGSAPEPVPGAAPEPVSPAAVPATPAAVPATPAVEPVTTPAE